MLKPLMPLLIRWFARIARDRQAVSNLMNIPLIAVLAVEELSRKNRSKNVATDRSRDQNVTNLLHSALLGEA